MLCFDIRLLYGRNKVIQGKLDALAVIAEQRGADKTDPFRVLMVGDSTMSHQYGAICGFMAEREGRRYDPDVRAPQRLLQPPSVVVGGVGNPIDGKGFLEAESPLFGLTCFLF